MRVLKEDVPNISYTPDNSDFFHAPKIVRSKLYWLFRMFWEMNLLYPGFPSNIDFQNARNCQNTSKDNHGEK